MSATSVALPAKEELKINSVDHCVTPKAQKQNIPNVKRWASVVKAQKKIHHTADLDSQRQEKVVSEALCITFPKSLENHKAFISGTERMLSCDVCLLELDSLPSLTNHIKTRKHEDNVITYLKGMLPDSMHHVMEFVSFCGPSLCCNLCRCKIEMSPHNFYETIINIIAHNFDEVHSSQKTDQEAFNQAYYTLKYFACTDSLIKRNFHLIETRVCPQFRCGLCNKNILFHENKENLKQNFILHLKSNNHVKNRLAVGVLELYDAARLYGGLRSEKNVYVLLNGNISCTYCDQVIETDLEKLISHENSTEHARQILSKLEINTRDENKSIIENKINQKKMSTFCNQKIYESAKKDATKSVSKPNTHCSSKIATLLSSIPFGMKYKDNIIENDKGSVTCLICDCEVPSNTYNLQTHLFGNNHKKNEEVKMSTKPGQSGLLQVTKEKSDNTLTEDENVNNLQEFPEPHDKENFEFPETVLVPNITLPSQSDLKTLKPSLNLEGKEELCLARTMSNSKILEEIPLFLRASKSHKIQTVSATFLKHNYDLLIKQNQLVQENEGFLVKNVDGKHTYCKLCKTLIPISLKLNVLEANVVSHLMTKNHKVNVTSDQLKNGLSKMLQIENNGEEAGKGGVARSLFNFNNGQEMSAEVKSNELHSPFRFCSPSGDSSKLFPTIAALQSPKPANTFDVKKENALHGENPLVPTSPFSLLKTDNVSSKKVSSTSLLSDEVFIFGKDDKTEPQKAGGTKMARLPVSIVSRAGVETDAEVLSRRQKQIDYGKNTEGYARFCRMVQRNKRSAQDPKTPPRELKCSRRTWDGMIRAWRRHLHQWDPPSTSSAPSTVHLDIKPLA